MEKDMRESFYTISSIYDREAPPVKSQGYGAVNKTWAMTTPVDMAQWMGALIRPSP